MSLPGYAKYKPSGVPWAPSMPSHWVAATLGRISVSKCDGPFGSGLKSEHYTDDGVRVIRLQNIRSTGFDGSSEAFIDERYCREQLNGHDVLTGDLLVAGLGDERNTVGRACVAPAGIEPAIVKADCFRFRIDGALARPAFVALQLTAGAVFDGGVMSSGATRSRIPLSLMASRKVMLPPLDEQDAIVEFLGLETAKIDALVAEQRRLMELLQEKRQAVISHAVTKGLNPDAPMKASGLEWLGGVPAHWRIARMAELFREASDAGSDELPILSVSIHHGVSDDELTADESDRKVSRSEDRTKYKHVLPGDLVYNMMRAWQGAFGAVAVEGAVSPAYVVARPRESLATRFVELVLRTPRAVEEMRRYSRGVTDFRLRLYWDEFKCIRIALPPEDEATAILREVERLETEYDRMAEACRSCIDLLLERRAALISAAVTGQIDVRHLAAAEAA